MKKHQIAFLASLVLSLISAQVMAMGSINSDGIKVVGLFKNVAILNINHHRTVMRVGDGPQGSVQLLAANSERGIFEIHGRRVQLALSENTSFSTDLPTSNNYQAELISDGGLYTVAGTVNGQLSSFVVDTGSSYVTMSSQQASLLNIDYLHGRKVMMNTANGRTVAHLFTIRDIRIGGIELHNVAGAVMNNISSSKILLGMSFLNHVQMKHGNGYMLLKQQI